MKNHIWRINFKFNNPEYDHRPVFDARITLATRRRDLNQVSKEFDRIMKRLSDAYINPIVVGVEYIGELSK